MNTAFIIRGSSGSIFREDALSCLRRSGGAFTIMAGQRGAPGLSGAGANSTFTWNQATALTVWTIPHNLNRHPSVTVVDGLGRRVEPDVSYISNDIIQVTHGLPFSGVAYLN